MNVLYSSLNANETTRVKRCLTSKEIWDTLMKIHEGSNDMKEQKKSLLVTKYETFTCYQMNPLMLCFVDSMILLRTWKFGIKAIHWVRKIEKYWILCLRNGKINAQILKKRKT